MSFFLSLCVCVCLMSYASVLDRAYVKCVMSCAMSSQVTNVMAMFLISEMLHYVKSFHVSSVMSCYNTLRYAMPRYGIKKLPAFLI